MNVRRTISPLALSLLLCLPAGVAAQSVLMQAKTSAGSEVATIRTDSMRLLVPLHLLVGGLLFPDGTVQTTAAVGIDSVTSAQIVDGTIVSADINPGANIPDAKLATISSGGKVSNSATTATAGNTPGAIVARDGSGGFSAGYASVLDSLRVVGGEGSFLATGTYQSGTTVPPPVSGAGTRMMWYPEKAAFRAGSVDGTQWDGGNTTGDYSVAFGRNTKAGGPYSSAFGAATTATGASSTAFGINSIASGNEAFAAGAAVSASGDNSAAFGYLTNSQAYGSFVIGEYNVVSGTPTSWVSTEPLFVAGNGTPTTGSNALTLYKNGNLTIAGTLTQSSDARLKEDIEPLEGTLEKVMQLTPIRYRFRPNTGRPGGEQIGLTAQQVEPLFPELVKQDADGYLSLSYANLSAVLVKAVQEQQAKIRALQERNDALESEVAALKASQAEILRRLRTLETAGKR
jgi:hypothetical protein